LVEHAYVALVFGCRRVTHLERWILYVLKCTVISPFAVILEDNLFTIATL